MVCIKLDIKAGGCKAMALKHHLDSSRCAEYVKAVINLFNTADGLMNEIFELWEVVFGPVPP